MTFPEKPAEEKHTETMQNAGVFSAQSAGKGNDVRSYLIAATEDLSVPVGSTKAKSPAGATVKLYSIPPIASSVFHRMSCARAAANGSRTAGQTWSLHSHLLSEPVSNRLPQMVFPARVPPMPGEVRW